MSLHFCVIVVIYIFLAFTKNLWNHKNIHTVFQYQLDNLVSINLITKVYKSARLSISEDEINIFFKEFSEFCFVVCFLCFQWLDEWQPHQRVEILSEVVKCCDPECLKFFAHCLSQR